MLLLLAGSLLLLFITLSLGIFTRHLLEKIFHTAIQSDLLGIFLLGLIASTFYFNILSFWCPVNYLSLIPLTALSLLIALFLRKKVREIFRSVGNSLKFVFSAPCLLISLCMAVILFFYWIIPPGNPDSYLYHFHSILWYEKYKVVPGLAKLQGRFAFNPASFIIQAAYSFTDPAGQALYPLNGVLAGLFFMWLLLGLFQTRKSPTSLVYAILIFALYKPLLINISSPSSDTLVAVCLCYALMCLFRTLLTGEVRLSQTLVPCLIILYSLIAKLSAFPILLVLPYVFYLLPKKEKTIPLLLKIAAIVVLLYLPWLERNYILSGYLIYPFPSLDLFHPDWKAPLNILKLEIYCINVIPKIEGSRVPLSAPLPLSQWFIPWFTTFFRKGTPFDPVFFMVSILSPLYWIPVYVRTKRIETQLFVLWLIVYTGVWIWFLTSPVLRFGAVPLTLSIVFPAFIFFSRPPLKKPAHQEGLLARLPQLSGAYHLLLQLFFACAVIYFITSGYAKPTTYKFTLGDCWLYPLKAANLNAKEKAGFPYKLLRSGIRLYLPDSAHNSMNSALPCMEDQYGEIEMRGNTIAQGFRNVKDEVIIHYPLIQ
jgi:hypothetical protein